MRLLLGISLCPKHCLCSRGLPFPDFPVSEFGAVFPYELKPVTGPFHPLAVVTLASVEVGKCLLSLSGPISEQHNSALPDVAALASFGLPGSSLEAGNRCTSLPELCSPAEVCLRQGFPCCFSSWSLPQTCYKGGKKNNQGNYGPECLAASSWRISLEDGI